MQARGQESRRLRAVADETGRIGPETSRDHALEIAVIAELEAMGDPRGQILRMTIMEGLSHSDVADRLDLPLGTVKSHARRGLIHLRSMLKEVRDDD